jgi:hypothetical protein
LAEPRSIDARSRERALQLVAEVRDPRLTDSQADHLLTELEEILGCPHITDLVFWHEPDLRAEEVVDKALRYRPFAL